MSEREAANLLQQADRARSVVESIDFPAMRVGSLSHVRFVDCDVGRLTFGGGPLRRAQFVSCTFDRCTGPNHSVIRGATFIDCRWRQSRLSGVAERSAFQSCSFEAVEIQDLELRDVGLDDVRFADTDIDGLHATKSTWSSVAFDGRARRLSVIDTTLRDVDLSRLHVIDGSFLDVSVERVEFPSFDDSFAVSPIDVGRIKPRLLDLVRPEARPSLEHALGDSQPSDIEFFDLPRLDALYGDGPRLMPDEQRAVLGALFEVRLPSAERSRGRQE